MDRRLFTASVAGLAAVGAAGLAGCGVNSNPLAEPSTSTNDSGATPAGPVGSDGIVVGSADFTESEILAEIYAQALTAKGIKASTKLRIGSREIYLKALQDGSIHAVPEYTGNLLQYLDAGNPAQSADDITTALSTAVGDKLKVLKAAKAVDQDVYVVAHDYAETHTLTSLADLKKISATSILGGPSELKERAYGPVGLEQIYGAKFKSFQVYDSNAVKVKDLNDNKIQVATFFTTESAIADNNYVMLEDPQQMILPQQVIPLVTSAVGNDAAAVAVLETVQDLLTTEDLTAMNKLVDVDHSDAKTVATDYLTRNNLI